MSSDDRIKIHCPPEHILTLAIPTTKGRFVRADQAKRWAQSISSDDGTLSRKPKLWDKVITKTEVTRQRLIDASAISIISIVYLSFLHQTKKKSDVTIYQNEKNKGQRVLEKMDFLFSGSSLSIDVEVEPPWIQISTISEESVCILYPRFFSMSHQPDTIRFGHTISSIMKSRFWSLFTSCLHQFPKRAQNARDFD